MKPLVPIRLAWLRFTSCSGCQLMLVNCESALTDLAQLVVLDNFPLVSSACNQDAQLDIALVEGSLTSPAEVERLLALRRQTRLLVAVGACALSGGVNTLVRGDRRSAMTKIYAGQGGGWDSFPPQPAHHFVQVDYRIPGCPPERHELLQAMTALLHGGWPGRQVMAVCMECRINESRCLLIEDHAACLGPVTAAGCNARCPGLGIPCEGCRGFMAEANRDEMARLLMEAGLSAQAIGHRLERFGEPS